MAATTTGNIGNHSSDSQVASALANSQATITTDNSTTQTATSTGNQSPASTYSEVGTVDNTSNIDNNSGQAVAASGGSIVTINNFIRNYYQLPIEPGQPPTMKTIKQMIDAVIATTKNEAEAARLEICRAYLFNPCLAGKLENKMLAQISKQAG